MPGVVLIDIYPPLVSLFLASTMAHLWRSHPPSLHLIGRLPRQSDPPWYSYLAYFHNTPFDIRYLFDLVAPLLGVCGIVLPCYFPHLSFPIQGRE
jgi:hypothetical protein